MEEEALFIELKRLEQNERDFARERDELLRVLDGVESGLAGVAAQSIADEEEYALMLGEGKATATKKRKGALDVDSPLSAGLGMGTSVSAPPVKKARTAKEIAEGYSSSSSTLATKLTAITYVDAKNCIHRWDNVTSAPGASTKAAHQPVFFRSYKLPNVKSAAFQRVSQVVSELGLRSDRLVMPTYDNVQHLDQLLNAAVALVDTRKLVERVEQDIRIYKERIALKEGRANENGDAEGETQKKEGEEDADGSGDDDDAEGDEDADGETDRAVSVAASAISRKDVSLSTPLT